MNDLLPLISRHGYLLLAAAWFAEAIGPPLPAARALLRVLCRLRPSPQTCIRCSAEYFARRGKQTLLFAKFIPGINTMSPPLAGSMKMRLGDFLQFDALDRKS